MALISSGSAVAVDGEYARGKGGRVCGERVTRGAVGVHGAGNGDACALSA